MSSKLVIVEMTEDTAAWLQLNPALGKIRVIGEFVPATPNKTLAVSSGKKGTHHEFPRGTKLQCGVRPPDSAPQRRKVWEVLRDKFGDMIVDRNDATDSVVAATSWPRTTVSPLVSKMLKQRELKPVTEG